MEQSKTEHDRARRSLQIMQAALEKAKTNHGDLFTFGDCASVYAAMMNMNNFIDNHEPKETIPVPQQQQIPQTQNIVQQSTQPFLTLNQTPSVNYQTN